MQIIRSEDGYSPYAKDGSRVIGALRHHALDGFANHTENSLSLVSPQVSETSERPMGMLFSDGVRANRP